MPALLLSRMIDNPIRVLNAIGISLNDLVWITGGLALISLIISLAAWRRSRKSPVTGQSTAIAAPTAAAVPAAATSVNDPVLIAVITAAVAMMLAEGPKAGPATVAVAGSQALAASPAGFTIRQVRRV